VFAEPMHAARLVLLEGALCSLLREAQSGEDASDAPDQITVSLGPEGVEIQYWTRGLPVGGEGM
jgi:hypothetical protein